MVCAWQAQHPPPHPTPRPASVHSVSVNFVPEILGLPGIPELCVFAGGHPVLLASSVRSTRALLSLTVLRHGLHGQGRWRGVLRKLRQRLFLQLLHVGLDTRQHIKSRLTCRQRPPDASFAVC